jgi:hypothetical protein
MSSSRQYRVGLRYRWVPGLATVLPDDDPLARQRRIIRWPQPTEDAVRLPNTTPGDQDARSGPEHPLGDGRMCRVTPTDVERC